ncbi:MAG TPA: metal-dependent hydrolase [Candidatus Babeliales bacterium]|nr:metal-dependent hydrolase [Candidatus Babeliales bacterium]
MPGYKGHTVGGLTIYGITLYLLRSILKPTWLNAIEWLLFTLTGALFPDIDVKSKGQQLSYALILGIFVILLLRDQFDAVAILAVLALIPMVVRHRGLFHRLWFILIFAGIIVVVCFFSTTLSCRMILLDAGFFVLGAISHLWLDMGFKGLFRK